MRPNGPFTPFTGEHSAHENNQIFQNQVVKSVYGNRLSQGHPEYFMQGRKKVPGLYFLTPSGRQSSTLHWARSTLLRAQKHVALIQVNGHIPFIFKQSTIQNTHTHTVALDLLSKDRPQGGVLIQMVLLHEDIHLASVTLFLRYNTRMAEAYFYYIKLMETHLPYDQQEVVL